jgi:hypothetical protein
LVEFHGRFNNSQNFLNCSSFPIPMMIGLSLV